MKVSPQLFMVPKQSFQGHSMRASIKVSKNVTKTSFYTASTRSLQGSVQKLLQVLCSSSIPCCKYCVLQVFPAIIMLLQDNNAPKMLIQTRSFMLYFQCLRSVLMIKLTHLFFLQFWELNVFFPWWCDYTVLDYVVVLWYHFYFLNCCRSHSLTVMMMSLLIAS